MLGLSVATLFHPSVTFLAVQSGMVGLLLTVLLAVMQRLVGGRGPGPAVYVEPGSRAAALVAAGSTMTRVGTVGSDDSTAIRPRPAATSSTMDHVPASPRRAPTDGDGPAPAPGPERAGAGGRAGA